MVTTTRASSQLFSANSVAAALLQASRNSISQPATSTPQNTTYFSVYTILLTTEKRSVIRLLLSACQGKFHCEKCSAVEGELVLSSERSPTTAIICCKKSCDQKFQGAGLLKKLTKTIAKINEDRSKDKTDGSFGNEKTAGTEKVGKETPESKMNIARLEPAAKTSTTAEDNYDRELVLLRRENELLRKQLESKTALLQKKSLQITELILEAIKLVDKRDEMATVER